MAEPTQSTPPTDNLLPLPAVQMWQPKKPQRKMRPWHWAVICVIAPFLILFEAVGAYTVAHWAFNRPPASVVNLAGATPTPAGKHHNKPPKPPKPAYDLAGYKATVDGTDEQTFVVALNRLRSDIKRLSLQTVTTDALTLSGAANTYLADLKATNPPPAYGAAKLANITAAILARRAAATAQSAVSAANLTSFQTGLAQANRAKQALVQAVSVTPKGS